MPESDGNGSLADSDIRLFESGNLADATIVCGDRTWKVHKVILGSRCKWFKAAFYGNMAEATTGKVVLYEQDPDLVDLALRFIYSKKVDIEDHYEQLKGNKGVPLLCVQAFRVADFFLLDELKKEAVSELRLMLLLSFPDSNTIMFPDSETGEAYHPKWLAEILDAVEDAFKDMSTAPIRETLLDFIYKRRHTIFRFDDAVALLDKIPEVGKDLMKMNITGDLANRQTNFRFGLPVLKAARGHAYGYNAVGHSTIPAYRLYPAQRTNFKAFTVVDPNTELEYDSLHWITPSANKIRRMTSHCESKFVLVEMKPTGSKSLSIRFDACADASLYVELYCRINPDIVRVQAPEAASLASIMPRQVRG